MVECVRIQLWEQYAFAGTLSVAGITLAVLYSLHPDAFYRLVSSILLFSVIMYAASYTLFRNMALVERWLLSANAGLGAQPVLHALRHMVS